MGRKKKNAVDQKIVIIANNYKAGMYGKGRTAEKRINDLGMGNIYTKVKEYAKVIK